MLESWEDRFFGNTGELGMLRETVRRAAEERIAPLAATIDEQGVFDRDVEALCWDLGLMTMALPPEWDGLEQDQGMSSPKLASMAKCFASDSAMKITTDAVQVLGGYGYTKDYPVERMFRDAKLT